MSQDDDDEQVESEPEKPAKKRGSTPAPAREKKAEAKPWMDPLRRRRLLIAVAIYVGAVIVMAIVAGPQRLKEHTPFNHYAQLASAWLHGRNDLAQGPPAYAQGNDFAFFEGKWFISFPPFPAMLMLPLVALAGSPEEFQDGQFIVWLSGIAPAVLFLVLEKLRRTGRSDRTEMQNIGLSLLFAFGTVYFFTAVQGTVWFAAHVVGAGLLCLYLLVALDASSPLIAGLLLGLMFLTRPTTVLAAPVFAFEALRVCCKDGFVTEGSLADRVEGTWDRVEKGPFLRRCVMFAVPVLVALGFASLYNHARFHTYNPNAFGHEYLTVVWQGRMEKWGLFGWHYLAKNLGVSLTILPWFMPKGATDGTPRTTLLVLCLPFLLLPLFASTKAKAPESDTSDKSSSLSAVAIISALGVFAVTMFVLFAGNNDPAPAFQINEHGLALWFTTPFYFWLLWPKKKGYLHAVVWLSAIGPIAFDLMYQNSGWRQFGYRFSNDYAPLLFVLLAIGGRSFGTMFRGAAAWALAWNLFGAVSFDRSNFEKYYWREGTQKILYQDD